MKSSTFFVFIVSAGSLMFHSCGNTTNKTQPLALTGASTAPIQKEFDLDLANTVLLYQDFLQQSGDFVNYFRTSTGTFSQRQYETVTIQGLRQVIDTLSGMSNEYFTGFRFAYALDSNMLIKLYYIPLIADSTGMVDTLKQFTFNIADSDLDDILTNYPEKVFFSESGRLVNVTSTTDGVAEAEQNYLRYLSSIRIYNPITETFVGFNPEKDPKSSFITMQEIDSVASDNSADLVYFTSATKKTGNSYRQSITVTSEITNTPGSQDTPGFTNKAGNLAQMCPIRCTSIRVLNNSIFK